MQQFKTAAIIKNDEGAQSLPCMPFGTLSSKRNYIKMPGLSTLKKQLLFFTKSVNSVRIISKNSNCNCR